METHSPDVKWTLAPDVRITVTQDGGVLLDINGGQCYTLNQVATTIWRTIEDHPGIDVNGIVAVLAKDFTVPREQLAADTRELLDHLRRQHLIRSSGLGTAPKRRWRW